MKSPNVIFPQFRPVAQREWKENVHKILEVQTVNKEM